MPSIKAAVIVTNVVFSLLSLGTASTRLHRTVIKAKALQIHDILLLFALVCGLAEATIQCVATKYGLGTNQRLTPRDLAEADIEIFLKLYLSFFATYFACNMFVKLSLLAFYRKLSPDNRFDWVLWVMAAVAVIFGIGSILSVCLSCVPLSKVWHPQLPGRCINLEAFYYANGGFMIFNDIILYILPIVIVRGVQLSKAKAAAMNLLFALGFIVVIASLMRMKAIHDLFSLPLFSLYYQAILLIWCTIENHLALIIICLPACKAAVVAFAPSLATSSSSLWSRIVGKKESSQLRPLGMPYDSSNSSGSRQSTKKSKSWFSDWASQDETGKSRSSVIGTRSFGRSGHDRTVGGDEIELRKDIYITVEEGTHSPKEDHHSVSSSPSIDEREVPI